MGRCAGNVCKLCRREGMKLFLKGQRCFSEKCGINRRDYPPGMHTRPRKTTDYYTQLREKQKAKRIYGVQESQFRKSFANAVRQKGNTGVPAARQLVGRFEGTLDAAPDLGHGFDQVGDSHAELRSPLLSSAHPPRWLTAWIQSAPFPIIRAR